MQKTNLGLVEYAKNALKEGYGYCLGTFGNILTAELLNQKCTQGFGVGEYNTQHRAYLAKFLGKRVSDCYGLVKGYIWLDNGVIKYNPKQDINQDTAFDRAVRKGILDTMPEIKGLILSMGGHAGVYIGDGEFIECVGAPVGMRLGRLEQGKVVSGSRFTHWFMDKELIYKQEDLVTQTKISLINRNKQHREAVVERILYNDTNFVKLRDLEKLGFKVSYDELRGNPLIQSMEDFT